jgi:hypothetical protein
MHALFAALEQSAPSTWMREDAYAYFIALILHAWGMALLVGSGIVLSLRVLGVARGTPLWKFRGFLPVMWLGAGLAVVSGIGLLLGYPAKALTNPVFAVKLACLAAAALLVRRLVHGALGPATRDETLPARSRAIAATTLVLWLGVVAGGKLLLYTYTVLMVSR